MVGFIAIGIFIGVGMVFLAIAEDHERQVRREQKRLIRRLVRKSSEKKQEQRHYSRYTHAGCSGKGR